MTYRFQPMAELNARRIIKWRYDPPYDYYNPDPRRDAENISHFLNPHNPYYEIHDHTGALIGFCCFGAEGQVPGGTYDNSALDIGIGMKPDLTGSGRGNDFFTAILNFANDTFSPSAFRVTVALFNNRAIRLYQKTGFDRINLFKNPADGETFIQMTRSV